MARKFVREIKRREDHLVIDNLRFVGSAAKRISK